MAHAAELVGRVTEEREPIVILQNDEARAVLVDVRSYNAPQETMAFLQISAISEHEIAGRETYLLQEVARSLREGRPRLRAGRGKDKSEKRRPAFSRTSK